MADSSASGDVDGIVVGKTASFLRLGAIIQSFRVAGTDINLVQGFDDAQDYRHHNAPYFGETIGRVANRIADARIKSLNGGHQYTLDCNDGGVNCLHGGHRGWGKKQWTLVSHELLGADHANGEDGVKIKFSCCSGNGDGGFPGDVDIRVTYIDRVERLDERAVSVLDIEYEAELVPGQDVKETIVAMTNHRYDHAKPAPNSYFNLNGANTSATVDGTEAILSTTTHLPVDVNNIPTGAMANFAGLQANVPFTLSAQHSDIDHCFVLNTEPASVTTDTRAMRLQKLASFHHAQSQVRLEVYSTEPAFQFYMGKYIDVPRVRNIPARGPRTGFCIEPCRYVNAANVHEWKGMAVLRQGEKYGSRIVYRAWLDNEANS